MSLPLFNRAAHRAIEAEAHQSGGVGLMERAGAAAAKVALAMAGSRNSPALVLAGPGNNGGDAFVAARHLEAVGWQTHVALLDRARPYHGDALTAFEAFVSAGGQVHDDWDERAQFSIVVDGLFGIGLDRPLAGRALEWVERINRRAGRAPVLALDIPSGIDAETGALLGDAVRATETLAFLGAKPGLYTGIGPEHVGHVSIDSLGLRSSVAASGWLSGPDLFGPALRPRRAASHKGDFGRLGVVAGASGMVGAALLCARMALYAGCGRIYVHAPGPHPPEVDWMHPELMFRSGLSELELDAVVAGCGLGHSEAALSVLKTVIARRVPVVFDADALNAMAADEGLAHGVAKRVAPTIITPHPLEAARLLKTTAQGVEHDRPEAARRLAERLRAIVVLKGAGTVIASPDAPLVINPTGNPALATGGTGDVLAGLVGALLAQGWDARSAAIGGVWMHGRAADQSVAEGKGPIGFTASELFESVREVFNQLVARGA